MDKRQCTNCGAPLKSLGWGKYKCEYCGTEYKEEDCFGEIKYIAVNTPPYQTLVAKTAIDDYWIKKLLIKNIKLPDYSLIYKIL